ncbi:MAG: MFS transporter [Gammaproteobacteria bacterium]
MNAVLKFFLSAMIAVSVVSDSMLMPFYPQFFQTAFGDTDPEHVGFYLAAVCFTVMAAFPLWAAVAKTVPVLRLLVYTQFAAGVLSILCYASDTLLNFWMVSLLMMVFKASYLLIYPHILALEDKNKHTGTIGVLSVIVHLGAIMGAALGGFVLELLDARQTFLLMSIGDFLQMFACMLLTDKDKAIAPAAGDASSARALTPGLVYKLSLIMLLYYFSAYLIRPFFARYWETVSVWNGEIASGLVFAIPGWIALAALCLGRFAGNRLQSAYGGILSAVFLGIYGLLLQAYPQPAAVLLGRCLFGWSLFKATVRLDALLFELSTPDAYAADFSKIYFFQTLGVMIASFAAGALVSHQGLQSPFMVGAFGLSVTAFCYALLFRSERRAKAAMPPDEAVLET